MYPGLQTAIRPNQPAIVMAQSGETITYAELERRSNRFAHFLRANGINSYLTPDELAYILDNSQSKILITSTAKREVAVKALAQCPQIERCLIVDGAGDGARVVNLDAAVDEFPDTPIADESLGAALLYSSGTTGRPKGVLRPLPESSPARQLPILDFFRDAWRFRDGMIYLSPAPLYHAAPLVGVSLTIRAGGIAVIMEHFDPEQCLALVERYRVTHSQFVPTMFSRMLKLPDAARRRYDLSSLEIAIHAAAPCPILVKEQMIDWWGSIIFQPPSGSRTSIYA
jgi:long-chain acyl-CoA synthetase